MKSYLKAAPINKNVLDVLTEMGQTNDREASAITLGFASFREVEKMMCRANYIWEKESNNFIENDQMISEVTTMFVEEMIENLYKEDRLFIATSIITMLKLGVNKYDTYGGEFLMPHRNKEFISITFNSYEEVVAFMQIEGYRWNPSIRNYMNQDGEIAAMKTVINQ